jgi:hypothetical protein
MNSPRLSFRLTIKGIRTAIEYGMKSILSKFGGSKQALEKPRPADAEPKGGQTGSQS